MQQAASSLALDIQAMAQLDRWMSLPRDAQARMLADLAHTDPPLHARLASLAKASGSESQADDPGASRALALPLLQATQGLFTPGLHADAVLGGWRLLRELGRGGMSVVWLAERADGSLKRQVALKLPLAAQLSDKLSERFARERDVLAQLAHPHIARLYDAGVAESGQPFIALEHVLGQPITQFADERHLGVRQRLQLFQQVLAAVDHAHRHLVVHRDLKPANILVDEEGQVKLLDFGIAKLLALPADAAALTQEAGAVMTPRYAAPEQVAGGAISTSTDVYAAGVVLYELLTGLLPLGTADASMAGLAHAVLHNEPLPPSQAATDPALRRQLAGDIDTVVLKAMRKDPAERYASIERFSEDLRRVLAHEPILARRVSLGHRLRLLVRRHRAISIGAGLAAGTLIVMAVTLLLQFQASSAQRLRADAVRDFMFEMISDAEADERSTVGEISGQQMLKAAVLRAQQGFPAQPLVRGEVLGELGRMNMRLQDNKAAQDTLRQAVALMERNGPGSNPALNKARAHLARLLIDSQGEDAETLAQRALISCDSPSLDCAKARSYAHSALRDLADSRSQDETALRHARAAVQESTLAFGPQDPSTIQALEAQASVARNAGALTEAQMALSRAVQAAENRTLRVIERFSLQRLQGVLQMDLGHYQAAIDSFKRLIPMASTAEDLMVLHRLMAQCFLAIGDVDEAMKAAQSALLTPASPSVDSVQRLLAQLAQAQTWMLMRRLEQAESELQSVDAELRRNGFDASTAEALRTQRLMVGIAWQSGQVTLANDRLSALLDAHRSATPERKLEHALALDLAGCMALETSLIGSASGLHAAARERLAILLPADHPHLMRNALHLARAHWHASASAESQRSLLTAVARYRSLMPPTSGWQSILDVAVLPASETTREGPSVCLL